jgi:hypothetical protein
MGVAASSTALAIPISVANDGPNQALASLGPRVIMGHSCDCTGPRYCDATCHQKCVASILADHTDADPENVDPDFIIPKKQGRKRQKILSFIKYCPKIFHLNIG